MSDVNFLDVLRDYWKVAVGLLLLILALGETRWQVQELIRDQEIDKRQTANIRNNIVNIAEHVVEIEGMQLHMGPDAIQAYGALRETVKWHTRQIESHIERHQ